MEISSLREMGFEDPCIMSQWQMSSFDELGVLPMAAVLGGQISSSFSQPTINFKASMDYPSNNSRPSKQLKPNTWGSGKTNPFPAGQQQVNSSNTFSAVNSNLTNQNAMLKPKEEETVSSKNMGGHRSGSMSSQAPVVNQNYVAKASSQGVKREISSNRLAQTHDHIMAERKRREKLSELFIALSALVPGLKKMDKASVLGDAINYLKQLQEKVQMLEEQTRKKTAESVVFIKRSHLNFSDKKSCVTDDNSSNGPLDEPLPEIEARISYQDVLIKIHCEKRKGTMEKIISEVEKLHLTITNTSSMAFGNFTVDITIVAQQMDPEFGLSIKDLVRKLRSALSSIM